MDIIERPPDLMTAQARLCAIARRMSLQQGVVLQYVKKEALFVEQGFDSFEKWGATSMKDQRWGVSDLRTVNSYARAGYIAVYLHDRKGYCAEAIFSKLVGPSPLSKLMPRTFSPSQTPWEDGDNLRIDKTELTALLAVMDSGGDVKAALKERERKQSLQQPPAECEPGEQQQQQQIEAQQQQQQQQPVGARQSCATQQHDLEKPKTMCLRQRKQPTTQASPSATGNTRAGTSAAVKRRHCKSGAKAKTKPTCTAATGMGQEPMLIPPPKGLLPLDTSWWHSRALSCADAHLRVLAATSMCNSAAANTATSSAAAPEQRLTPCHRVVTAPSGTQLHTIVTAPVTDLDEYAASLHEALSGGNQHRTVVIVPVVSCSLLGCYLLHLSGHTSMASAPQLLLVSQHGFEKTTDQGLFLELEAKIHDSLKADEPVALSSQELSGFVLLKGDNLLVSIPEGCKQLEDISLDHLVARVYPTPASGFTVEQMQAFSSSALPACRALLDLGGSLPKQLDSQIAARCETVLKHCQSTGVSPVSKFNAVLEVVLRLLAGCRPFIGGVKRQKQTRGTSGIFYSDGLRASGGGGLDTAARGWHIGTAEWYHDVGPLYSPKDAAAEREAKLVQVKQWQQAWRECRAPLMSLLYSYLCRTLGSVLLAYQSSTSLQPGMEDVRLQADVPYQQMQSSLNANVGVHIDDGDLLGTVIIWLSLAAAVTAAAPAAGGKRRRAPEPANNSPGGAFVLYDLGCAFEVGHLSHLWVRSDKHWHGTIRDYGLPEQATADALLAGTAFANKTDVTREVLKVWHMGGQVTWRRQYDADPVDATEVMPPSGPVARRRV